MNLLQRIAALFGRNYVAVVGDVCVSVEAVETVASLWIISGSGRRIEPSGRICGRNALWLPLTRGVRKYYNAHTPQK